MSIQRNFFNLITNNTISSTTASTNYVNQTTHRHVFNTHRSKRRMSNRHDYDDILDLMRHLFRWSYHAYVVQTTAPTTILSSIAYRRMDSFLVGDAGKQCISLMIIAIFTARQLLCDKDWQRQ